MGDETGDDVRLKLLRSLSEQASLELQLAFLVDLNCCLDSLSFVIIVLFFVRPNKSSSSLFMNSF